MDPIERRISRLEQENRRLRYLVALALTLSGLSWTAVLLSPVSASAQTSGVLRTERIIFEKNGDSYGSIGVGEDNYVRMHLVKPGFPDDSAGIFGLVTDEKAWLGVSGPGDEGMSVELSAGSGRCGNVFIRGDGRRSVVWSAP